MTLRSLVAPAWLASSVMGETSKENNEAAMMSASGSVGAYVGGGAVKPSSTGTGGANYIPSR